MKVIGLASKGLKILQEARRRNRRCLLSRFRALYVSTTSALAIALTIASYSQGDMVVVCPFEIQGNSALRQVIYDPQEFYQMYRNYWLVLPAGVEMMLPPACAPEDNDRGPACEGCKDFNKTYYECFHIRDPEQISDCADNWCIIVDLKLKTCYVRPAGTEPNRCRVLRRSKNEGASPAVTHTVKYWRRHGESWCRATGVRGPWAIVHYGCPECDKVERQRIWCPANEESIRKCNEGPLVPKEVLGQPNPITSDYGFVCANDNCTPSTGGNEGGNNR